MRTKIRQLPVIPQNPLPPLYASWLDGVLDGPIPNESDATCNNCAMLPDDGAAETDSNQYFNSQTKCCTYLPELHNFLAGRILADEDTSFAKGRRTVQARLKARIGVTPLGMGQTPMYSLVYHNSPDVFGHAANMRCPHYINEEGGRCGVWKNRESVCVTWFCKYTRGATGKNFWTKLLHLLSFIERNVSLWCVTQLDVGTDALQILLPLFKRSEAEKPTAKEIDGKSDEKMYRAKWGKWFGREEEFYKECALLASDLKWADIENICGPELKIHTRLMQEAYKKLVSDELPQRLKVGSFQLGGMEQNAFAVSGYSGFDTLRLSKPIISILQYFDGRPVTEVLDEIVEKEKLRVSPELIKKLVVFEMLVATEK
jgi:hypothetical protein